MVAGTISCMHPGGEGQSDVGTACSMFAVGGLMADVGKWHVADNSNAAGGPQNWLDCCWRQL